MLNFTRTRALQYDVEFMKSPPPKAQRAGACAKLSGRLRGDASRRRQAGFTAAVCEAVAACTGPPHLAHR